MVTVSDLRTEDFFIFNGYPHKVIKKELYKPSDDSSFVKIKAFNLDTGEMLNYTMDPSTPLIKPDMDSSVLKMKERKDNSIVLYSEETGEETEIDGSVAGRRNIYLKTGSDVTALYYRNMFAGIELPRFVSVEVEQTEDIEKDSTNTEFTKDAKLSNGHIIKVPAFIKTGDKVQILLDNGEYIRRDE